MDPGRGCPPQILGRGQYVHSSYRSEVEEVGPSHKVPREHTEHTDKTGTGRAEGEEMRPACRTPSQMFRKASCELSRLPDLMGI
jgi:hypothetical protein